MLFYNYLAAVEVQPQSVATPTQGPDSYSQIYTCALLALIAAAPLPGQRIDCPGQILQIRDCPGDSGTVPEIPGQLEPMDFSLLISTHRNCFYGDCAVSWSFDATI